MSHSIDMSNEYVHSLIGRRIRAEFRARGVDQFVDPGKEEEVWMA